MHCIETIKLNSLSSTTPLIASRDAIRRKFILFFLYSISCVKKLNARIQNELFPSFVYDKLIFIACWVNNHSPPMWWLATGIDDEILRRNVLFFVEFNKIWFVWCAPTEAATVNLLFSLSFIHISGNDDDVQQKTKTHQCLRLNAQQMYNVVSKESEKKTKNVERANRTNVSWSNLRFINF